MGYYVNPPNESKETFLGKYGIVVPLDTTWNSIPSDCVGVVLMDNGLFRAAGIAFSPDELDEFRRPDDFRKKTLYLIEKKILVSIGCIWPGCKGGE